MNFNYDKDYLQFLLEHVFSKSDNPLDVIYHFNNLKKYYKYMEAKSEQKDYEISRLTKVNEKITNKNSELEELNKKLKKDYNRVYERKLTLKERLFGKILN